MSDFEQQLPPVPPAPSAPPAGFGAPQPAAPFGVPGAPTPPPAAGWYGPPGVAGYPLPAAPTAGQRPKVVVGSVLLIVGGVLLVVGSFLNWAKVSLGGIGFDTSFNGFGSGDETKDGPVFVFFALVLAGFGLTMLLARKVLAVSILAVIFAALAVLVAVADLKDVSDLADELNVFGSTVDVQVGPGLWVVLLGAVISLAGGIATLVVRRKP